MYLAASSCLTLFKALKSILILSHGLWFPSTRVLYYGLHYRLSAWQSFFTPWMLDIRYGTQENWTIRLTMTLLLTKEPSGVKFCDKLSSNILMIDVCRILIFEVKPDLLHALFICRTCQYMMIRGPESCISVSLVHMVPRFVLVVTLACRSVIKIARKKFVITSAALTTNFFWILVSIFPALVHWLRKGCNESQINSS